MANLYSSVPFTNFLQKAPPATSTQLIYNSRLLIDGILLYGSTPDQLLNTGSATPRLWFGPTTNFSFDKTKEYEISFNLAAIKSGSIDGRMDVFLVGTGFTNPTSSLGQCIATYAIPTTTNLRFFEKQTILISPKVTGTARLRFVMYSGQWNVSDLNITEANEFGFNPSQTRLVVPINGRRYENLQFKINLYDVNNNVVPINIESDPVFFNGGSTHIKGDSNRIDGILIVSPSGSGPVLGTSSSGSFIGISSDNNLPQPIHPDILTTTIYTGNPIITIYSGSTPFSASSAGPAVGIQFAGGPSGSFLDFNGITGRLTIKGDILLLPSSSLSQSVVSGTSGNTALAQIQALVSGNLLGGTYLNGNMIISPIIAGNSGYFSTQFGVGNITGGNGIVLTALGYTSSGGTSVPNAPAIYIGQGRHFNSNTPFLVASSSSGPVFSLGNKVSFQPSGSSYEAIVSGSLAVEWAGPGNGFFNVLSVIAQTATQSVVTNNANLAFSSSILNASISSVSASNAQTSASLISVSQSLAARDISFSASLAASIASVSASQASISSSTAQGITSASILDSVNKIIRLPTTSKTTRGLYIESSSIGFWQPHPSGSGISSSNFPVIINDNGQFRFANSSSWSGSSVNGAFTEQIAFANGAFVVQSKNIFLSSDGIQMIGSNSTASSANVLKIGISASLLSLGTGSGFYADGAGNFRVGESGIGNDAITLVPRSGLIISASNFFLEVDSATLQGPQKLKINRSEIALGSPIPTSYSPTSTTGSNLVRNPNAEQDTSIGWSSAATQTWITSSDASPPEGNRVFDIVGLHDIFHDDILPIDITRRYTYSVYGRTNSGSNAQTYLSIRCYDDKYREIYPEHYYAPGNYTASLSIAATSASTQVTLDDATNFIDDNNGHIAFDIKSDGSDTPNFFTRRILSGSKSGNTFSIMPGSDRGSVVGADFPIGTKVRFHRSSGTYIYPVSSVNMTNSFARYSGDVGGIIAFPSETGSIAGIAGWRPKTKYARIGLLVNYNDVGNTTSSRFDRFEFTNISQGASGFYTNAAGQLFVGSGSVGTHAGEGTGSWISFGGTDLNIRTEKLYLNTPGLSILGSNNVANSNAIKLGANASGLTLSSGSGAYLDGDGNFRFGTGVSDISASYIQFTPGNALIISSSNLFVLSNSGSAQLLISPFEISVGDPRPRTFEPTAASPGRGFYVNNAGQLFIGSGSAASGQESGDWISFGGQLLNIRATAIRLWASGSFKVDSTSGSGFIGLGSATGYGIGTGVWADGLGRFRAGNPTGTRIQFDSANFLLTTTNMRIDSISIPHIALGSATAFTVGNGIWLDGSNQFRVGTPVGSAGTKIAYDGTDLILSSSTFALDTTGMRISSLRQVIMLGSAVTTINNGTGTFLSGSGDFRVGNPVGPRISFNTGVLTVSASQFGLQTSTVFIDSTSGRIALGASAPAISFGGTGVYMDGTGQFSVGSPSGLLTFNGSRLVISGSRSGLAISGSAKLTGLTVVRLDTSQDYAVIGSEIPYDQNANLSGQPIVPAGLSVVNDLIVGNQGRILPEFGISGSIGYLHRSGIIAGSDLRWTYGAFNDGINIRTFAGPNNNVAPTSSFSTSAPSGTPPVGTIHIRY